MTCPCQMWSVGPRVHGGKEACGRLAVRCWIDVRNGGDRIPICESCIVNLNYDATLLRRL